MKWQNQAHICYTCSDYTEIVINQIRLISAVEKGGKWYAAACLMQRTGILVAGKLLTTMLLATWFRFNNSAGFSSGPGESDGVAYTCQVVW